MTSAAVTSRPRWRLASPATAWLLAAVILLLLAASPVLASQSHELTIGSFWSSVLVYLPLGAVGLVVAARQPGNPIGWLFLGLMLLSVLGQDGGYYAVLIYRLGDRLPLGQAAALLALYWSLVLVAFPLLILLFPDGKLPSRRWRWVMWVYLPVAACWPVSIYIVGVQAIAAGHTQVVSGGDLRIVDYPTGNAAWLATVETVILPVLAGFWLLFVLRQVLSWRRAGGERRQQLKWLMLGTAVSMVCTALVAVVSTLDTATASPALQNAFSLVSIGIAALPVCIGVAILKYRLYDIDRIISRTLAYAVLTGLLVGVYAGLVLLATQVLPLSSSVAVAGSTLVAAALFSPLRRRVQALVDRRFNRARYDADQMIEAFTGRLQDEVDLDSVRGDLMAAVHSALEPAHVSVWLARPRA
ncbi:MAG TPA: hypothetical protein VIX86_22780 [Streptosporangiaceae bacterium]